MDLLRVQETQESGIWQPSGEVVVQDLQELIAVLTQDDWQPSESKYRMNIAYRGLSTADYELETGLARLQDRSTAALEEHLLRNFRKYAHRDAPRSCR